MFSLHVGADMIIRWDDTVSRQVEVEGRRGCVPGNTARAATLSNSEPTCPFLLHHHDDSDDDNFQHNKNVCTRNSHLI